MASSNVFKNKVSANVGTSEVSTYTSPAGKTATIIGMCIANTTTSSIFVSVRMYDTSTSTHVYLIKDAPVPVGGSLVVIGGDQKVVLENGDIIKVISDTASSADVILSVMELDGV